MKKWLAKLGPFLVVLILLFSYYRAENLFSSRMEEDMQRLATELLAAEMPTAQIQAVEDAMDAVHDNVRFYVNSVFHVLPALLFILFYRLESIHSKLKRDVQ